MITNMRSLVEKTAEHLDLPLSFDEFSRFCKARGLEHNEKAVTEYAENAYHFAKRETGEDSAE